MVDARQCGDKNEIPKGTTSNQANLLLSICVGSLLQLSPRPDMAVSCWRSGFLLDDLPNRSVLVDVDGGISAQSILVADAYLRVHLIAEDREQVVSTAVSVRSSPLFGRCLWYGAIDH